MAFWDKEIETMPRDRLEELQVERLRKTVLRCQKSPFYGQTLKGFDVSKIKSPEDVRLLPLTTKQDLREHYKYGFLTVPREDIVRMHASSGTTGRATVIFHTQKDIDTWANLVARCVTMTGAHKGDVFQNMISYGLFTGGLGLHYGAEKAGLMVIPTGVGNTKRQIHFMQDFESTVFHATPSYALHVSEEMEREGVDPKSLSLRIGFVGAEPHSEQTRKKIEEIYEMDVFNSYGMSELNGPGVAFECEEKCGMHIWEDSYLLEVLDPKTLEPVKPGREGMLVVSTINREGMPLLRYKTNDLAKIYIDECPCGRTHVRISRIKGRCDDMMIVSGVNTYPSQIEDVLMTFPEVATTYQIHLETAGNMDRMTVKVELQPRMFDGDLKKLRDLEKRIVKALQDEIVIKPRLEFLEPGTLPRTEGKAVRVVDKRGDRYGETN